MDSPSKENATPALPDPQDLRTPALSDSLRRRLFYGVTALILIILIASIFGPGTPAPAPATARALKQTPQPPSVAQVNDLKESIDASTRLIQENIAYDKEATDTKDAEKRTLVELQNADAVRDGQQQRALFDATHGTSGNNGSSPQERRQQREELTYKSLFADNRVSQTGQALSLHHSASAPPTTAVSSNEEASLASEPQEERSQKHETAGSSPDNTQKKRRPLDFDPAAHSLYWLPEGTVIEAELTNRLEGEQPGPVNVMITNDVYKPGTRLVLIPQGARALGEAREVTLLGQQRLAVTFHRILTPGLDGYGIPLDKLEPGLGQAGETGLHDKLNNHYTSIFGASLAVGAIGGLAQIGNSQNSFGYDPGVQFRSGISSGMSQSADRILDRFLNRLPSLTIREGTRVKIILTDDLSLPAYQSKRE